MVAIGRARFVKGHWIKPGAVVIDVGTNAISDSTKKSGSSLVGDVEFETAEKVAGWITPVPGGVGPMTVAMLMQNTLKSANRWFDLHRKREVKPLPITPRVPVPADIDIALAQTPKHLETLCQEIGLSASEVNIT